MLQVDKITKIFSSGDTKVAALKDVTFSVPQGQFASIIGRSGSGKSTLLSILGALEKPTSGSIEVDGQDIVKLHDHALIKYRGQKIGFIFQNYNLVPNLTAIENVMLPMEYAKVPKKERLTRAKKLLAQVGLEEDQQQRKPGRLSGGQQQRVAIARALVTRPEVVFGDEPTGALDTMTARDVLTLLREVVSALGQTVVMVTHDPVSAAYADTVLFLADGRIVDAMTAPTAEKVAERMTRLGAWK